MDSKAPKFASFKPKPKAPPEPTNTLETAAPAQKPKSLEPERKNQGSDQPKEKRRKTSHTPFSTQRDVTSDLFFSDRRGDPDILRYGTVNPRDVPRYQSIGHGYVLGLPLDRKIDRHLSTDKVVVITPKMGGSRQNPILSQKNALSEDTKSIRFVKTATEETRLDADFIGFSENVNQKSNDRHDDDDLDDNNGQAEGSRAHEIADYRRLDPGPPGNKPSDPDAEYESDTVSAVNTKIITQRSGALLRHTREHPEDVEGWLNLIEHQEAMLTIGRVSADLSLSDKQQLAKVRISVYEQALHKLSSNKASQAKLYPGFMSEAAIVWDALRLGEKWNDVLDMFPLDTDLWYQYLNYIQSKFDGFFYKECHDAFMKCLRALQTGENRTSPHEHFKLHVLVRMTTMMYQAGYYYMATGIWQAILDYRFSQPLSDAPLSDEDALLLFGEFWDSDAPRIGEEGATGWLNFDIANIPKFSDRAEDEDLLGAILFSDIEEMLQLLPRNVSAASLMNAFLCYCQMPPIMQEDNVQRYQLDPFLQHKFASLPAAIKGSDAFSNVLKRCSGCPLKKYQMTTELLFDEAFPLESNVVDTDFLRRVLQFIVSKQAGSKDSIAVYLLALESKYFPSEAFKTAKTLIRAHPTSLYLYSAYGLVVSKRGKSEKADQIFSAALSMQQQQAHDQPLSSHGSIDLFSNWVWEALRRGDQYLALLRLLCLNTQLYNSTLGDGPPSQSEILRARTHLSDIVSRALLQGDFIRAVKSTSLLALLSYVSPSSSPSPIDAALSAHSTLTQNLETHPNTACAQELHAQSIAALLTHHTIHAYSPFTQGREQKSIVRPSLLRHTLEPLLRLFPSNTILLGLYAANEARFALNDRVRDLFTSWRYAHKSSGDDYPDIVAAAFAIHHERLRAYATATTTSVSIESTSSPQKQLVPNLNPVRAVFASLISTPSKSFIRNCPTLNIAYAEFELEQYLINSSGPGKKDAKNRLRKAYLAGLTNVPWYKEYIVLGLEVAAELKEEGQVHEEGDLNTILANVMVEKGVEAMMGV